jgi:hypothetical protein
VLWALTGCAAQAVGTSRFPASATYTAQATTAGPGSSQEDIRVTAELVDCVGRPKLVLGPDCTLSGTWNEGAPVTTTAWNAGYRTGTLTLDAGQSCVVPAGAGTAEDLVITRGTVKVNEAHAADVNLAAEVSTGTLKGTAVTFAFTAPADGPARPCSGP